MNDPAASRELLIVLATMAALFLFGLVAVVIFIRTWRRERSPGRGRQPAGSQDKR